QIGRAIGEDGLNTTTGQRIAIPALELFTHGLYTSDALLRAAEEALAKGPQQ
ncbi:MAG: hypothetical protein JWR53_1513, partial [Glaciihabitans sp.]|nr:hypothetical protein [Glaciihabitans sp.]